MGNLKKFNTPAYQAEKDLANSTDEQKEAFDAVWSNYVEVQTIISQIGNPYTTKVDSPRYNYFNPLRSEYPTPSDENTEPIDWIGFPNRIAHFFHDEFIKLFGKDADEKIHELADIGPNAFEAKYKKDYPTLSMLIPNHPCNPNSKPSVPYNPMGPRGWQDEYCEWTVRRSTSETHEDGLAKITAVNFTHENPEYWFNLWRIAPDLVLKLYRETLNKPDIQLEDLYLLDSKGDPVIVPETGKPAYNPINKYNNGPLISPEGIGGAMHLTSPPNDLGAEIFLAAAATTQRSVKPYNANSMVCCSQYGEIFRNSDPHIGFTVNQLVGGQNLDLTLTNPVGLYGQKPDFSRYTLPPNAPKGAKPEDYYTIVRGLEKAPADKDYYPRSMILHWKYEVPEGLGFTVGDILIDGKPIRWGAQIALTFHVQLAGTGRKPAKNLEKLPCVSAESSNRVPPLPEAGYLMNYQLLLASLENNLETLSNVTTVITQVERGQTTQNLALTIADGTKDTVIDFGKGFEILNLKTEFYEGSSIQVFDLKVAADVPLGNVELTLSNPPEAGIASPGSLFVVEEGSFPPQATTSSSVVDGQPLLTAEQAKVLVQLMKKGR